MKILLKLHEALGECNFKSLNEGPGTPITHNTFWHRRVRFCWTTFLETAVCLFLATFGSRRARGPLKHGKPQNSRTKIHFSNRNS